MTPQVLLALNIASGLLSLIREHQAAADLTEQQVMDRLASELDESDASLDGLRTAVERKGQRE